MLMDLGLVALIGRVIVFMILDFIGHILLLDPVAGVVVGIQIAPARAQPVRALIMRIAQWRRHLTARRFGVGHGCVNGADHAIALGTFADGDDGLRQGQPGLGHADQFQRLPGCHSLQHGDGIGQAPHPHWHGQ